MNKRNYELTLNVTTGKIKIPSISIYNTDKGIFNIKLFLEKGEGKNTVKLTHDEMVNYKALFQAVKSKTKNYVELEGILDETENFFYYDLGSKFNDQVGVYNCQMFITDTNGTDDSTTDDEVVTSVPFNYTVTASILTGLNAEIEANPDLPVLKELINECKILMDLDSADMSVLDPFQKKEDSAIDGADKNIISNINSINSQIKEKANLNEVVKKGYGTLNDFDEDTRAVLQGLEPGQINAVLGEGNVIVTNLNTDLVNAIYDTSATSDSEINLEIETSIANKKSYFNSQYKLMGFSDSVANNCCKVFKLKANETYNIEGLGNNDEANPISVVCEQLTTDTTGTIKYTDAFLGTTTSLIYEKASYTPAVDCYAYVNGTNASVKKVVNMYEPYAPKNRQLINEINNKINEIKTGIIVKDGLQTIIHFIKDKDVYVCREFQHCFINNLFQLKKMYTANLNDNQLVKISDIGESWSDVVGPLSISRGSVDGYLGSWSGGSHEIRVDGVDYPTAKEIDFKIYVDKEIIANDGFYKGDCRIVTVNDLYFPKTITSADLSTATKAIKETRTYNLTSKMEVDVKIEFYQDVHVVQYYGCQCNTYNMTKVYLPNSEKATSMIDLSSQVDFGEKESRYYCSNEIGQHYDVTLKNYGLSNYKYNNSNQNGYVATFKKIYFILIQDEAEKKIFTPSQVVSWGAIYDFYLE